MRELRLKGVNFRGTLAALERREGASARSRVIEAVPGACGDALRTGEIVAGGWYPASWYATLLSTIDSVIGGGETYVRSLSRDAVKDDFQTLFRVISLVVSPDSALKNAVRVLGRYVEGGRTQVLEARPGYVHFRFDDFYGYTRLMWADFQGGTEGVLACMKLRDVTCEIVTGGNDGEHFFEIIHRWAP